MSRRQHIVYVSIRPTLKRVQSSDIRQVPDNQEVLIDPESDLSFVIEILQRVEKEDDKEAIE